MDLVYLAELSGRNTANSELCIQTGIHDRRSESFGAAGAANFGMAQSEP
jgi:hypothetical protein